MGTGSGAGNGSGGANGSLGTRNSNELSISGSLPKLYSLRTFAMNKSRLKTLQIPNEFRARFAFRSGNLDRARTPPPVRAANSLHSRHPAPPPATEFRIPLHLLTQAFGTCPSRNCHPGRRNLSHPITSRGVSRVLEDKTHSFAPVPEIDQKSKKPARFDFCILARIPHAVDTADCQSPPQNSLYAESLKGAARPDCSTRTPPSGSARMCGADICLPSSLHEPAVSKILCHPERSGSERSEPPRSRKIPASSTRNLMFAFYSPHVILPKTQLHHPCDK